MTILIRKIEYALPANTVTNDQLRAEFPHWNMAQLEDRTGVLSRHVASSGETALDLAVLACRKLENHGISMAKNIDAIIFCTETPDYPIPPNANLLHGILDMPTTSMAFDITAGCSGYLYGLEIARGLISAGSASRVLLVTGDTYSRLINPGDRAARCLFGDGAAASVIEAAPAGQGILDCALGSAGKKHDRFIVKAGGTRRPKDDLTGVEVKDRSGNIRTAENIEMDGFGVLTFFNELVPRETRAILQRNDLTTDNIDLFVFHQASGMVLDSLQRVLAIPDHKMARELSDVGNLVSASVPVTLERCIRKGMAKPGSLVLLCGFGVGLSWGSAILRMPEV